jgi:hypothetical protein
MKCYTCAKAGITMDAVALCSVCGMGLCMDHAIHREVGVVQPVVGLRTKPTMQVLCQTCLDALVQTE